MNFKSLLNLVTEASLISEAVVRTGDTLRKESAKAGAADNKAKDAARKRAERARQIPRERQSKEQLIKQVIAVKTGRGKLELIFKDSFNPDIHTKVSEKELTMSEASQLYQDPNFEQTRASILLFGQKGGEKEKEKGVKAPTEKEQKKAPEEAEAPAPAKPKKARKMTPDEMYASLSAMSPQDLAILPADVRQEYFKSMRQTVSNRDFDNAMGSYEELSVKFGFNPLSSLPYNQQVLNAFMFLAKIKSGASDQEMQTYNVISPTALEFTKAAFNQAKKLLSQIGDDCIQNLLSSVEMNQKSVDSAGVSDMQCGNYRFKISAGGEISLSTSAFDQSNKTFRGYLANSIYGALQKQLANPSDEKTIQNFQELDVEAKQFGDKMLSPETLDQIKSDPEMAKKLQQTEVIDSDGISRGFVLDDAGNLNPFANLENYQNVFNKYSTKIFRGAKANKSPLIQDLSSSLLKTVLRGDGIVDPATAPNHVVTVNGVFPITDEYIDEISKTSNFEMKNAKELISSDNIQKYKPSAAAVLKNYRTVVEAKEPRVKKPSLDQLFVSKSSIDPLALIVKDIINKHDFSLNASLLPGFSPKDLNTVEYNYVRIGKKTVKIPVVNDETLTISQMMAENYSYVNDILIESMTNDFVLSNLESVGLISSAERLILRDGKINLLESAEAAEINLIQVFENVLQRIAENPDLLYEFHEVTYGDLAEEYVRDYKKEYRNYHGKAKQRKQRAARTRARELMKKKGIVKKGDGKDIDHKRPLRSGGSNGINNLRVRKKSDNRSDNGHKKGEKQNKDWK